MTINVSLNQLVNLQNETTAVTQINQNSNTITGGFTTALNTTGDKMLGTLDMNSNQILNLPAPATANSPARLQDLATVNSGSSITVPTITAGTNIVVSGTSAVTVSTITSPVFTSLSSTTLIVSGNANIGTVTTGTWQGTTIATGFLPTGTSSALGIVSAGSGLSVGAGVVSLNLGLANTWTGVQNLTGVTTGSNSATGQVGEVISSNITTASGVSMTSGSTKNITQITLTSGDWDVSGQAISTVTTGTVISAYFGIISNSSNAIGTFGVTSGAAGSVFSVLTGQNASLCVGPVQYNVSTSTVISLVCLPTFTGGTLSSYGYLLARRRR